MASIGLKKLLFFIGFAIPLIYLAYYAHFAANVPAFDEYRTVLSEFTKFIDANNFKAYYNYFFDSENESIQVILKIWLMLQYITTGNINFKWSIIIGNSVLLGIMILAYKILNTNGVKHPVYFIALMCLYFNFQYFSITLRTDVPWYYFTGFVGSYFALYFLSKEKFKLFYAFLLIALMGNASSLFLIPIGLSYFLLHKRWKLSILQLTLGLVFTYIFTSNSSAISDYNEGNFANLPSNILLLLGSFADVGLGFLPQIITAKSAGFFFLVLYICIVVFIFFKIAKGQFKSNDIFTLMVMLFLGIGLSAILIKRGGLDAPNNTYLLHPRYKFLSMNLFWMAIMYVFVELKNRPIVARPIAMVLLVFYLLSFIENDKLVKIYYQSLSMDAVTFPNSGLMVSDQENQYDKWRYIKNVLNNYSFYEYPQIPAFENILQFAKEYKGSSQMDEIRLWESESQIYPGGPMGTYLNIEGGSKGIRIGKYNGNYLVLKSEKNTLVYPAPNNSNYYKRLILGKTNMEMGFYTSVYKEFIPEGNYKVTLLNRKGADYVMYDTPIVYVK